MPQRRVIDRRRTHAKCQQVQRSQGDGGSFERKSAVPRDHIGSTGLVEISIIAQHMRQPAYIVSRYGNDSFTPCNLLVNWPTHIKIEYCTVCDDVRVLLLKCFKVAQAHTHAHTQLTIGRVDACIAKNYITRVAVCDDGHCLAANVCRLNLKVICLVS